MDLLLPQAPTVDETTTSAVGLVMSTTEAVVSENPAPKPISTAQQQQPSKDGQVASTALAQSVIQLPFPSVDIPSLNNFKRMIDMKNVESVDNLIEQNPRYLINYSSDGPTILRQGARYNPVIYATVVNAPTVLSCILKKINSLFFIQRCYPAITDEEQLLEKRNRFLDSYLNTPDKVLYNTPLHFACRAHFIQCIKVLLNYMPTIDIKLKNKNGKTPMELVSDAKLKPVIEELFSNCMFVTVLRNEGDLNVKVNPPIYGRKSIESVQMENKNLAKISAIAGPMSPKNAELFYKTLKSPKHCNKKQVSFRMKDPVRGVEKVARDISLELQVPCKESWPFLNEYIDITSPKGLDKLEQHLENNLKMKSFINLFDKLSVGISTLNHSSQLLNEVVQNDNLTSKESSKKEVEVFHDAAEKNSNDSDDDDDIFYSAPSSPIEEEPVEVYIAGETKGKVDDEVLTVLDMALEKGVVKLDELKQSRPLLYGWLTKLQNEPAQQLKQLQQ